MRVPAVKKDVLRAISDAITEAQDIYLPHDEAGVTRATIMAHLEAARTLVNETEWERRR